MRAEDAAAGIAVPRDVPALAPHEVLLRRRGVPRSLDQEGYAAGLEEMLTRWAESHRHRDGEDSDEGLGPLPDSDLLKAVHRYVAHFYAAGRGEAPDIDSRSMDETALLAFGVLLEEAAREALGETGDLALVEGEEEEVGGQRHAGGAEDAAGPRGVVLPNRPRGRPPKRRRIWIGTGHIRGAEGRM